MSNLKNNLLRLIKKNGLSIAATERHAGVPINTIQNILRGQSKNPSIDKLKKIANYFNCSISELVIDETIKPQNIDLSIISNYDQLVDFTIYVRSLAQEGNLKVSFYDFAHIQREWYTYMLENNLSTLDKNFVKWLIKQKIATNYDG